MKNYSSLGQHKTTFAALKCAEARLLFDKRGEKSILIFGDIFSELDEQRAENMFECLHDMGQVFFSECSVREKDWIDGHHITFQCRNGEIFSVKTSSVHA